MVEREYHAPSEREIQIAITFYELRGNKPQLLMVRPYIFYDPVFALSHHTCEPIVLIAHINIILLRVYSKLFVFLFLFLVTTYYVVLRSWPSE